MSQRDLERLSIPELHSRLESTTSDDKRLALLTALAWVYSPNDSVQAEEHNAAARAINERLGKPVFTGHHLRNEAYAALYRSNYAQALAAIDEAEAIYQRVHHTDQQILLDYMRAMIHFRLSDYVAAQEQAEQTLATAEATDDERMITTALSLLGSVAVIRENFPLAILCFQRCLTYYEARGYTRGLGKVYNNLGQVYRSQKRYDEALAAAAKALEYYEAAEDRRGQVYVNDMLGKLYCETGDYAAAAAHFRAVLEASTLLEDPLHRVNAMHELAYVQQLEGHYKQAIPRYLEVIALAQQQQAMHTTYSTHRELALCYEQVGDYQQALHHMREFHTLHDRLIHSEKEAQFQEAQARLELALVRKEAEIERLRTAETRHQLEHADRLTTLGKMAASIAHEINNPLQVVYGNLLLLAEAEEHAAQDELIQSAVEQIERITKLIAGMREMYQLDSQGEPYINLTETVQKVQILINKTLERQHIGLQLNLAHNLPLVAVSSTHMQQVILNLMLNAVDAMPSGGTMTITTQHETTQDAVILEILDTGEGISAANLKRVFDPFFTTRTHGSGLGLSISQTIIKHYGGELELTSEITKGTLALVRLPIAQAAEALRG